MIIQSSRNIGTNESVWCYNLMVLSGIYLMKCTTLPTFNPDPGHRLAGARGTPETSHPTSQVVHCSCVTGALTISAGYEFDCDIGLVFLTE